MIRKQTCPDASHLHPMRNLAGFLAAMIMPCIAVATLLFILGDRDESLLAFMTILPLTVLFGMMDVSLPATLVLGLPLFWLFRRFGWDQWWHYLLGGTSAGLATGLALAPLAILLFGALGGLAALSLWFVLFASRRSLAAMACLLAVALLAIGLLG